jgi:hypothetical protein
MIYERGARSSLYSHDGRKQYEHVEPTPRRVTVRAMNMPGLTAEASLYGTHERYRVAGYSHSRALDASVVQPAAAIYSGGRFICYGEVTPNGFINCYPPGGGLSEPPELVCGPCRNGRQRCGIPGVGFTTGPCIND